MVVPDPEPEEKNEQVIKPEDANEIEEMPKMKFFGDELIITGDFVVKTSVSEEEFKNRSLKIIVK